MYVYTCFIFGNQNKSAILSSLNTNTRKIFLIILFFDNAILDYFLIFNTQAFKLLLASNKDTKNFNIISSF